MRQKILVGEDNLVTQQVLKAVLENFSYEVTTATTGEALIQYLNNDTYQLLLLDYHLDQNADEVIQSIRSLANANHSIPVYVLSATSEEKIMPRLRSQDVSGFIKKPFDERQLQAILSRHDLRKPKENKIFLESIIGQNEERIKAIKQYFGEEVPAALIKIKQALKQEDFQTARALVHKVRPAYTYIGRDDIQVKLGDWETDLLQGTNQKNYDQIFQEINDQTALLLNTVAPKTTTAFTKITSSAKNKKLLGIRVLIVDDNKVLQAAFSAYLKTYGMIIFTADNGADAIAQIEGQSMDIILMDLHMPVMNGVEAITNLRQKGNATPIVAISNVIFLRPDAEAAGANDFLLKPIDGQELVGTLAAHID
ncbi:MAG TPA: hypothetical protein DIW27_07215 [Cytophagales bacterium]|nr:hypothetical protein [Cytophagales bacterium]